MKIQLNLSKVSFGYKSVLKTEWVDNPEMREHVKYGLYGGKLTQDTLSVDHLKPHSKGGKSKLSNYALATQKNNNSRASKPLSRCLTKEMFENYIEQFKGWTAQLFDNKQYIEDITRAVKKEGVKL